MFPIYRVGEIILLLGVTLHVSYNFIYKRNIFFVQHKLIYFYKLHSRKGYAVAQVVEALRYAGSIPDVVTEIYDWHNPSGPGVDSVSDRNEYQGYFQGIKAAGT